MRYDPYLRVRLVGGPYHNHHFVCDVSQSGLVMLDAAATPAADFSDLLIAEEPLRVQRYEFATVETNRGTRFIEAWHESLTNEQAMRERRDWTGFKILQAVLNLCVERLAKRHRLPVRRRRSA